MIMRKKTDQMVQRRLGDGLQAIAHVYSHGYLHQVIIVEREFWRIMPRPWFKKPCSMGSAAGQSSSPEAPRQNAGNAKYDQLFL